MNRNQLLTVLKINGCTESSPDEDIKAVLHNAKYNDSEIEAALLLIKQKTSQRVPRTDGLHTVFYSDSSLKPSEISGLLGVDVDLDIPISRRSRKSGLSFLDVTLIVGLSIAFALLGVFSYMYFTEIGFFYPVTNVL